MFLIQTLKKRISFEKAVFLVILVTLISLAFSIRFINSASIIVLVLLVLLNSQRIAMIKKAFGNPLFLALAALFLLQIAGLLYTNDINTGWREVTQKAGLIGIPFFFCAIRSIPVRRLRYIMIGFSLSLVFVCVYCLFYAIILYLHNPDSSVFFYHKLVSPFKHHAIFFSFFLFYCIIYWMEESIGTEKKNKHQKVLTGLVLFFIMMILLLSSKLVIGAIFLYLIVFVFYRLRNKRSLWMLFSFMIGLSTLIIIISITNNPIKARFADLTEGNSGLFRQEKFSTATYFNGLQFRLLTWRYTYEILYKRDAWLLGVSPGDAQHELNRRYKEMDMYLGDGKTDSGFWNFNCHNVYLQTTLESGCVGLLFLLLAIALFLIYAIKWHKFNALAFFAAIIAFGFTESITSSQYTILLFLFLPLLSLKEGNYDEQN
jgi:O-antigen ligase